MPLLGHITAPHGTLLVVDAGLLSLWSGRNPPLLAAHDADPSTVAIANSAVDLELVGDTPDALDRVGRAIDRQANPRFLFDVPANGRKELTTLVECTAKELGLAVTLRERPRRVSHRERFDLALAYGRGAGSVQFHGVGAAAFDDVPTGAHPVFADLRDDDRFARVVVRVRDTVVASTELVAHVGVDTAKLLVIDPDAAGEWTSNETLDGKADFVFWGRDAASLAEAVRAPQLDDGQFGWVDLPVREAVERGTEAERVKAKRGLKLATDFRPHSHVYQLLAQIRRGNPGSGTVAIGDAEACGFETSWGDGFFAVFRDRDEAGRLVQIRIELEPA
jgi:hypothetical protein